MLAAVSGLAGCMDTDLPTAPPAVGPTAPAFATYDVPCDPTDLIDALNAANADPDKAVIELEAGCTYTLTEADNAREGFGGTGLPILTRSITIEGNGAKIERSPEALDEFRIFFVSGGDVSITRLTIANGRATDNLGGGILLRSGGLTLTHSTVMGNNAWRGGGIYADGILTVTNSTIANNSSQGILASGAASILNSTISENGDIGVTNDGGELGIAHSTITGNDAGGVVSINDARTSVQNTIIVGNGGWDVSAGLTANRYQSLGYNVIGIDGGSVDFDEEFNAPGDQTDVADAMLDGLAFNAPGTSPTHAPLPGSPAIDAIPQGESGCGTEFTTDQRGVARPMGNTNRCDIGAFELDRFDETPPVITPTVTGTLGDNGWYTSDVTVSWSVVDEESDIDAMAGCDETIITSDTGGITLTCEASSAGGDASERVTVKRDATAPTLAPTVSPDPVLVGGSAVATPNASDDLSGVAAESCDAVDTGSVGSQSLTCTATDAAGNTAEQLVSYTVAFAFNGFLEPVSNPDIVNLAKAGRTIPLKWQLLDANGAPVTDLSGVTTTVENLSCGFEPTANEVGEEAAGASGLQNLGDGYYQYNWKTPKSYANSCKTLELDLGEGVVRTALFKFTR
jgi:hypothetical protein